MTVRVLAGMFWEPALETRSDGGLFSRVSAEPMPLSFADVTVPQSVATDGTAGTVPPPDRTVCHRNPIRVVMPGRVGAAGGDRGDGGGLIHQKFGSYTSVPVAWM